MTDFWTFYIAIWGLFIGITWWTIMKALSNLNYSKGMRFVPWG